VALEQLSIADGGVQVATAAHDALADIVIFDGQPLMAGGVVSTTSISNLHSLIFPYPSVAVYVTVVVPNGKTDPEL
jgi:hypothetical protein